MKNFYRFLATVIFFLFPCFSICHASEYPISIDSCQIGNDKTSIQVQASASSMPASDDGYFYLFELKSYEKELGSRTDYAAWADKDISAAFHTSLNYNQTDSRLCSKFLVAVKSKGKYVAVSSPCYITNPEILAEYTYPYPSASNKKGLLVEPSKISEISDLNLSHVCYNLRIDRFFGASTHTMYKTFYYTYNGKSYPINGHVVAEYDNIFKQLSDQNVIITAVLLNSYREEFPQLTHPLARDGNQAPYHAMNTYNAEGTQYLEAIASFLAERYSREDKAYGQVMNWIVGNEVNICKEWNYMSDVGMDTYVEEYAKSLRLFYTVIKSKNANARIYTSIDQRWNRTDETLNRYYNGKAFLDALNQTIRREGNIDWSLSQHPYPVPLTLPRFWDMPYIYAAINLIRADENTPIVSIKNIQVLTDYLQKSEYLSPNGQPRHFILSEIGFTSLAEGKTDLEGQAAALAYAYKIAEANDYIDAFLLTRQYDSAEEITQGLALGLHDSNGAAKPSYQVYKYLGTARSEEFIAFAKNIIGISDWGQVISRIQRIGGWKQDAHGWWYQNADASYPAAKWQLISNQWYYFDTRGYMMTGWILDGGKWYYLSSEGSMLTHCITPDGFWVDADGIYVE